ncbi:DUF1672 family protein [Metabacillus sp. 84]|uniref:DUF1672 family protein n=1 Tax=Metabacillus sp. 84 TaxID=3404705 RepID=UPI003CEECCDF
MKVTYSVLSIGLSLILLTGGCSSLERLESNSNKQVNKGEGTGASDQNVIGVQDYTGEGLVLPNSKGNNKISPEKKKEIEKAVKNYFISNYKTKIILHNIVGNQDGFTAFVESTDEPKFHTYAIVSTNADNVKTLKGQVENGIEGGLYAIIYKDKIRELKRYLTNVKNSYQITGRRTEAINNTSTSGFTTQDFYITPLDESLENLGKQYIENPQSTMEKVNSMKHYDIDPSNLLITIQLYMKEENVKPDIDVLNKVVEGLKKSNNLPPGNYVVYLNGNKIYKDTGTGSEENQLQSKDGTIIIK